MDRATAKGLSFGSALNTVSRDLKQSGVDVTTFSQSLRDNMAAHDQAAAAAERGAARQVAAAQSMQRRIGRFGGMAIAGAAGLPSPFMTGSLIGGLLPGAALGIAAGAEILGKMVEKVGELSNAWNPVILAQKQSLELLKSSIPELEKLTSQAERLTAQMEGRKFGTAFPLQLRAQSSAGDAKAQQGMIDYWQGQADALKQRIASGTHAGTPESTYIGKGGAEMIRPGTPGYVDPDAEAAQEKLIGVTAKLEDAILLKKNLQLDSEDAKAELGKDSLKKGRELASKIDSINKQTVEIRERSLSLADKARLDPYGAMGRLSVQRFAMERKYGRDLTDLDERQRVNRLGGPDEVRVPDSEYEKQRQAIYGARTQDRLSINKELGDTAFSDASQRVGDYNSRHDKIVKLQDADEKQQERWDDDVRKKRDATNEDIRKIGMGSSRSEAERQIRLAGMFAQYDTDNVQIGASVNIGGRPTSTAAYMRGGISAQSVSSSAGRSEKVGEAQAITQAYNERSKIIDAQQKSEQANITLIVDADKRRIADAELLRQITDERGQAELDRTKAILGLRSKQYAQDKEAFSSTVTGGFTALTHGSDAFGRFAREKAISFGTGIVSNAAGLGFNALTGAAGFHLPGSIVGTAQNPNLFGKLLGKGSFGPDQGGGLQLSQGALKTSTDSLRDAVIANTAVQGRAAGIDTSGIAGVAAVPISGGPLNIPGLGGSTTIYGGSAGQVPYDASPISTTLSDTAAYSRLAASSYGGGASGGAIVGDVGKLAKALGDRSISLGGGNATTLSSLLVPGAMIAGGAVGLYQGIKTGGARGGFESAAGGAGIASGVAGIAGALGVVSPILSALGPIGAIAAPLLGLVSAAFGDPKANFAQNQARDLRNNTYFAPAGQSVVSDTNGGMVSYGANGLPRGGSPYSAFGSSSSPGYFSHYNGYYTPVQAYNNPTFQIPAGQQAPPNPAPPVQQVNLTVHTMDSQSFSDNSGKIADAVKLAMQQGHSVRKEVVSASRLQS